MELDLNYTHNRLREACISLTEVIDDSNTNPSIIRERIKTLSNFIKNTLTDLSPEKQRILFLHDQDLLMFLSSFSIFKENLKQ